MFRCDRLNRHDEREQISGFSPVDRGYAISCFASQRAAENLVNRLKKLKCKGEGTINLS